MAISDEIMLKVENVSKVYKLGEIGGTTLRDELQRKFAKLRHKEDPTKKIGAKNYNKGEKFKALENVSFEVKKGERIGIIGHNGAGKSTLLKLISRVTGPTEGNIYLNGRVTSMLEVGTGFHPELTGRENIYMNGAILGMTKKEIDEKIEDIIEFSEVREFIDTPVKRYSSGMYVKLAFSVAAHLNSEILIMDEVLAVGDLNFQQKCLKKMRDVSLDQGKTILYVSHNMSTIKQLCQRVLVLNRGSLIYFGSIDDGIKLYKNSSLFNPLDSHSDIDNNYGLHIQTCRLLTMSKNFVDFSIFVENLCETSEALLRIVIFNEMHAPILTTYSEKFNVHLGLLSIAFRLDTSLLANGSYCADIILNKFTNNKIIKVDIMINAFSFIILNHLPPYGIEWKHDNWGSIQGPLTKITTK